MTRNHTIDVAKGLGIILVALGHNTRLVVPDHELFRVIFSFHMALFFFLSGVFIRESSAPGAFARARMHSLLKPYFVVLLLLGAAKTAYLLMGRTIPDASLTDYFIGMLYGTGETIAWPPMWYLPHLFVASAAALMAIKLHHATGGWLGYVLAPVSLTIGALGIAAFWQPGPLDLHARALHQLPGLPWSVDLIPITAAFLVAGHLLSQPARSLSFHAPGFIFALAVFAGLHAFWDVTMNLNLRTYGQPLVSTLQAVTGVYLCLAASAWLQRFSRLRQVLAYIGSGTLFILILHSFLFGKFEGWLSAFIHDSIWIGLIALALSIALPLLFWEIAQRSRWLAALFLPPKSA